MREQAATHRAENQLLTAGPVPAQEAAFFRHVVKEAALTVAKGGDRLKLYLPKDSERANVSRSTATRALNKLRSADTDTLPVIVDDDWRGGKQHVDIIIPKTIDGEAWSPRRAYLALTRATLAEDRKKQGGSEAAVAARWRCRDHPDGAVVETINRDYRCGVEDCDQSWSAPATVVRHRGEHDPIQVESRPAETINLHGASFATEVSSDPIQVESDGDSLQDDASFSRKDASS